MITCPNCQIKLKLEISGVFVVEMQGENPYRIWSADLHKCSDCFNEVLIYSTNGEPIHSSYHWSEKPIEEVIENLKNQGKLIYYEYEWNYKKQKTINFK
jgi:hypothetical protein